MTPESGETKQIEKGAIVPIASNVQIQFKGITGKMVKY
jgi:hypothetical protein